MTEIFSHNAVFSSSLKEFSWLGNCFRWKTICSLQPLKLDVLKLLKDTKLRSIKCTKAWIKTFFSGVGPKIFRGEVGFPQYFPPWSVNVFQWKSNKITVRENHLYILNAKLSLKETVIIFLLSRWTRLVEQTFFEKLASILPFCGSNVRA